MRPGLSSVMQRFVAAAAAIVIVLTATTSSNVVPYRQYLVCREPKSELCVVWLIEVQKALAIVRQDYSQEKIFHQCGLSNINVLLPETKYLKISRLNEVTILNYYCRKIKVIGNGNNETRDNEIHVQSKRLPRQVGYSPRGRYRGQTQSQYLAIDRGTGKDDGIAEAHSAVDSSRASVSGSSGMGQAQSQTIYDPSCENCLGKSEIEAESLKRRPTDTIDRGGPGGISQGPGLTGDNNQYGPGKGPVYGISQSSIPGSNTIYRPDQVVGPNDNLNRFNGNTQQGLPGGVGGPNKPGNGGSYNFNSEGLPRETGKEVYGPINGNGNIAYPARTPVESGYGINNQRPSTSSIDTRNPVYSNIPQNGIFTPNTGTGPSGTEFLNPKTGNGSGTGLNQQPPGINQGTFNPHLNGVPNTGNYGQSGQPNSGSYGPGILGPNQPDLGGAPGLTNFANSPGNTLASTPLGVNQHNIPSSELLRPTYNSIPGVNSIYGTNHGAATPMEPSETGYGSQHGGLPGQTNAGSLGPNLLRLPEESGTYGPNRIGQPISSGPYGFGKPTGSGEVGGNTQLQPEPYGLNTLGNWPYGSRTIIAPDGTTYYCCTTGLNNNPRYYKPTSGLQGTTSQTDIPNRTGTVGVQNGLNIPNEQSNGPQNLLAPGTPYGRPEGNYASQGPFKPLTIQGVPIGTSNIGEQYSPGLTNGKNNLEGPAVQYRPNNLGQNNLVSPTGYSKPGYSLAQHGPGSSDGQFGIGDTVLQNGPRYTNRPYGSGDKSLQYSPGNREGQYSPDGTGSQFISGVTGSQIPPGGTVNQYTPLGKGSQLTPGGTGTQYIPGVTGSQLTPGGSGTQYNPGSSASQFTPGGTGNQYIPGVTGSQLAPGGSGTQYSPGSTGSQFTPGSTGNQYTPEATGSLLTPGSTGNQYTPGITRNQYTPGSTVNQYIPGSIGNQYSPRDPGSQYTPGGTGGQLHPGGSGSQYIPGITKSQLNPGGTGNLYFPGSTGGHLIPGGTGSQNIPVGTGSQNIPEGTDSHYSPGNQYNPEGISKQFNPGTTGLSYGPEGTREPYNPSGQLGPEGTGGSYIPGGTGRQYVPDTIGMQFGPDSTRGQYAPSGVAGQNGLQGPRNNYASNAGQNSPIASNGQYSPGFTTGQQTPSGQYDNNVLSNGFNSGTQYGTGLSTGQTGYVLPDNAYSRGSTPTGNAPTAGDNLRDPRLNVGQNSVYSPNENTAQYRPLYGNGGTNGQPESGLYGFNNQASVGQKHDYSGTPQNVIDPNLATGSIDGDDSEAEASVSQATNGTVANASSKGGNEKGRAQTHVHGAYTDSGSFSAQAEISSDDKTANSQVSGDKKGASSNAQGSGRNNKSQANVQLGSETGSVLTGSQSDGVMHSSNTQVQGSVKGGMADAQARGPGSTSSQAQIGFTPYKNGDKSHELQKTPFIGGGTAAAQSSGRTGSSQSQLRGTFKYGITYNGAAQAGASLNKDTVFSNRLPFDKIDVYDQNNKNINVNTEKPSDVMDNNIPTTEYLPVPDNLDLPAKVAEPEQRPVGSPTEVIPSTDVPFEIQTTTEKPKDTEPEYSDHVHADHHKENSQPAIPTAVPPVESRRSFPSTYGSNGGDYEYTTDKDDNPPDDYDVDDGFASEGGEAVEGEQGEYTNYNEFTRGSESTHQSLQSPKRKGVEVSQKAGGNTQHIVLGSLSNHDAQITQKNSEHPDEGKVYQPGERVPGTGGYTIPVGFTGSVKSVASKDNTFVVGSKDSPSQAQTVSLTPGTGKIKYTHPSAFTRNIHPKNLRSLDNNNPDDGNRYVSVSKSVTRDLDSEDNIRKQYSHTYFTKSSSCGYFSFTCTMVSDAGGKRKVCKPKLPTNPDGTVMRC